MHENGIILFPVPARYNFGQRPKSDNNLVNTFEHEADREGGVNEDSMLINSENSTGGL